MSITKPVVTGSTVVLIMAGGTGGHIFPALAVAEVLKQQGASIEWLGTKNGMEARLVPEHGYPINYIDISGLRGKGIKTLLTLPFKLLKALMQTLGVYRRIKPDVVLGMGGFVTGPGGLVARLMRKPLVLHEQNAIAGLTNKLLFKMADKVFAAFPGAFKTAHKLSIIGNPVRHEIAKLPAPQQRLEQKWKQEQYAENCLNILVIGGSLGAMALNETIPQALILMMQNSLLQEDNQESDFNCIAVRHQSGEKHLHKTMANYNKLKQYNEIHYEVVAFIKDMASNYQWADLIICRSGALTVSEIAAAGLASILVPFPYAVDDHQTANATYLADQGAAILIQQKDLEKQQLAELLSTLNKQKIMTMSVKARQLSITDAAEIVARKCLSLAG